MIKKDLPKIAIVGRPNVGKSSLYNRMIGRRESIIHDTPGITRDRNYGLVSFNKHNFLLIDTGGIEEKTSGDFIKDSIKKQVNIAICEADLILFILEASTLSSDDYLVASMLRKSGKSVIVVVNKADNKAQENTAGYEFAFSNLVFVSAIHGKNIDLLLDLISSFIPIVSIDEEKTADAINVAIIGRPNVGKSSLLNKILGKDRSLVSSMPGTTRDTISESISILGFNFHFLDTAGMRKRSKVQNDIEYYSVNRAIRSLERSNIGILLIDAIDSITEQDKKILSIAASRGKAVIIAVNKWDIIDKEESFANYADNIRFKFAIGNYIPIISVSALTGLRINNLLKLVIKVYKQYEKRIDTKDLNKVLLDAQRKHSTGSRKGVLKLYYGTQVSKAPPRFLLFLNKQELLTKNYKDYLINILRKTFDFTGVPIFIHTKKSS